MGAQAEQMGTHFECHCVSTCLEQSGGTGAAALDKWLQRFVIIVTLLTFILMLTKTVGLWEYFFCDSSPCLKKKRLGLPLPATFHLTTSPAVVNRRE